MTKTDWEKTVIGSLIFSFEKGDITKKELAKGIGNLLKREREGMGKALRMKERKLYGDKVGKRDIWGRGYNHAVKENNQAIDNYLGGKK